MLPTLYQKYLGVDAVDMFGMNMPRAHFGSSHFHFINDTPISFIETNAERIGTFLSSARHIEWRPLGSSRPDEHFLEKMTERDGHLFVRLPRGKEYIYLGPSRVGSYSKDGSYMGIGLRNSLPKNIWIELGGYPGWLINGETIENSERSKFDVFIAEVWKANASHVSMTRFEGDILDVHLNENLAWLMYRTDEEHSGLYINNGASPDTPVAEFVCDCGIELEVPSSQTVSRQEAAEIVTFLFVNSELPRKYQWVES